jgi:hypothetical protein
MSHWRIQVECRLRWRIRRQYPSSDCAGRSVGKIQIHCTLEGPLRSRAGSAAYAGRFTGGREDDQEDGLVELPEVLTDTGGTYAGEWPDPRQAQLETELNDDGESSGERSGADEGSGERSRRTRARGHLCGRLCTAEYTRRIKCLSSLSPSLSLVRAQIYFDSPLQPNPADRSISRAPPGSSGAGLSG